MGGRRLRTFRACRVREVKEGEANVVAGGRLRLPVRAGGAGPRVFRAVKLTIEIIDDHLL
jgi:hypothetical protein